jgi:hypothetical protein
MAADYAKSVLREPAVAYNLTGRKDGDQFNIVTAFGNFCERDLIDGVEDGDLTSVKLIKKIEDMIEDSGMGFTRKKADKKKKGETVSEAAILRSMIRRAIR